ncbi:hypothetical protein ACVBAX_11870 [Robertmurraya sp. GLU-23]
MIRTVAASEVAKESEWAHDSNSPSCNQVRVPPTIHTALSPEAASMRKYELKIESILLLVTNG